MRYWNNSEAFRKFAGSDKEKAFSDSQDEFVSKLQKSIEKIRNSRKVVQAI